MAYRGRRLYSEIAKKIQGKIDENSAYESMAADGLVEKILNCEPGIDYQKYSMPFAQLYWQRNFWKAVCFFESKADRSFLKNICDLGVELKILILGAGSAADTLACMSWLEKSGFSKQKVTITLIDRSEEQLDLARKVIETVSSHWNKINFQVEFEKIDIKNWIPKHNSADLVLMSHVLTENPSEVELLFEKAKAVVRARGRIITIERERDSVWQKAKEILISKGIPTVDMSVDRDLLVKLLRREKPDLLEITPHYVLARLPESKEMVELVAKYFQAWRGQSVDLVEEIFTKDAIYHEKPLIDGPIIGLGAIKDYWAENPLQQKNITIKATGIAYELGQVMCEFGGDFDTSKQHIDIQGIMIFDIDPYRGRIKALREYFNTKKYPFNKRISFS